MKRICISLSVLFISAISLSAQITQKQADTIVENYLQNERIEYELLYVHINTPNQEGITITTSNEEIFTAKYACWAYYVDESELSQRHYLFVKEDNGNLLEVIASDDNNFHPEQWKPVETTSLDDLKINTLKLLYPNPTTGKLTIDNGELAIESIELFDMKGKKLPFLLERDGSEVKIDISHFPAGVYLVSICDRKTKVIYKIIKK